MSVPPIPAFMKDPFDFDSSMKYLERELQEALGSITGGGRIVMGEEGMAFLKKVLLDVIDKRLGDWHDHITVEWKDERMSAVFTPKTELGARMIAELTAPIVMVTIPLDEAMQ